MRIFAEGVLGMDSVFCQFEKWFQSKLSEWAQKGVTVEKFGLGEFGHQYWIKVKCENGLGNIVLHESNGIYWVDFEAGNYDYDVMYIESNISFVDVKELDDYEIEFINHITWNGNED